MILLLILLPFISSFLSLSLKDNSYYFSIIASAIAAICAFYNLFLPIEQFTYNLVLLKVDGISAIFIFLTSILTLVCIIVSKTYTKGYIALFFLLQTIITIFFTSTDLLTFFIFFEFSLVPMFFIIGIWGSSNRIYAAYKFFLYTLTGSIGFLVAIVFIYAKTGTLYFENLKEILPYLTINTQKFLWIALFFAFAVKIPMFPLHTWLPDAHVQAPTGGSIMLAGILIKLGAYGFLKLSIPMLPSASEYFAPLILILSAIAIIYTSIVAIMQEDMKKMIAYSSIAHMGVVTAGLFSLTEEGINGAIFQMVSHGIVSGALFLCVGLLYSRANTRKIDFYSGLVNKMPIFSFLFITFTMASIGLPGTSGFIGEFLSLIGVFKISYIYAILCTTGVILSACYMLYLCKRVIWGNCTMQIQDIKILESIPLFMLLFGVIMLGFFPNLILNYIKIY